MIPQIINNKKNFLLFLLIIIFSSLVLNVCVYFAGIYSISADESGRTILAYKWIKGFYTGAPSWLPFYTIVTGYVIKIFPDLFVTPRLLISFFGVLAFISLIWLTQELFKDRYITLLSSIIVLFFPSRVILSSVPLSESMFFFFVLTGIAFFTRWLNKKNNILLIPASLSFALSSTVRYEGWIFSAVFIFVLIIFKRLRAANIKPALIWLTVFIGLAFPVYWLIYQADVSGHPLQFFYDMNKHYERSQGITLPSILKNNYLTRFIHHNIIYLCFPGLFMLGYLFLRDNRIRKWVSLPLLVFIPLTLISFTGRGVPTHNIWRIPELWNILLIPFTVYFIININSFNAKYFKNLKSSSISLIIPLMLIYYLVFIYNFKSEINFTKEELRIGEYIEQYIISREPDSKILIETLDWSFLHIAVASDHPENFIKSTEGGNPEIRRNQSIADSSNTDIKDLNEKKIKYIMIKTPAFKKRIKNTSLFAEIKSFNEWSVYKIK